MDEIINKVANSPLQIFDLEAYYLEGTRTQIDIAQWLYEGLLLKEKEFREALENHNWAQYQDHFVALYCSTEAIIPSWANLLVTSKLIPFAKKIILGNLED